MKKIEKKFEKSGIRYTFERMSDLRFQVRINGQFIMSSLVNDPAAIDEELSALGYTSRKEVYDECIEDSISLLHSPI